MSSRNLRRRLEDILAMCAEIVAFTAGMSFAEFERDPKTVKAVLYNLAVIGEVASQLLPEVELLYPEIPWVDIRGIRNLIIHEYFRVNLNIVWETIRTDLPPLVHQLEDINRKFRQRKLAIALKLSNLSAYCDLKHPHLAIASTSNLTIET